jgi:uncharacterized lipoprotein YehR (DUF1307 family)
MKKIILILLFMMVAMVGCDQSTTTEKTTAIEDPCSVDSTSSACLALYDERTVFEYTDMAIQREMIYDFEEDENGFEIVALDNGVADYLEDDGAIKLAGEGDNDERTSYIYNRISVPKEITYGLIIKYRTSTDGSSVRVRFFDRFNQETVLMDWTDVQSTDLTVSEFDLTAYKGQTIVLYVEQKSNQAAENYVQVEDIRFGISGAISTKTSWTFDTDLEDWQAENNGRQYDHSEWQDGHVYLDGSDFGLPEEPAERNGWVFNMFQIDENATSVTFSFDIWANPGVSDANFRIRVFDENLNEYVLNTSGDWENFVDPTPFRYTVDLTQFAGQRIAIFMESDDDGEGSGEGIYLDNFNLDILYSEE